MKNFLLLIFTLFFSYIGCINAQQPEVYTNKLYNYNKAVALFNNKQYLTAQIIFDQLKNQNYSVEMLSDIEFYSALAAIKLNQSSSDETMLAFIKNNPTSSKQNIAYVEVATYYFEQGKFSLAVEWFEKVDETTLTDADKEKFNFYKGYSFFNSNKKKESKVYFDKVINSTEYGSQSKYYLGFLAYEGNNYKEANKLFDQVSDNSNYKETLSYFQADMNFKLGKFDDAVKLGQKALSKSNDAEKSELNKIIGESYFNLKQYDKTIPFLTAYKGKNGKWNNTDYYQLGYAYYKQKDYENAINQFNKIISGNDFVAQNAYYHLGESYLNTNKKTQALNAFKNASEMTFDVKIQEDAFLNYARLSYDIGNSYQAVPDVLNGFLNKYATSTNKSEIENLLINSFVTSKNYDAALLLLEKNKSSNNNLIYQKVLLYRGLELFTDGSYTDALPLFQKSISQQKDNTLSAQATFWKAETEFNKQDFDNAILSYKQFLNYAEAKNTKEFSAINYHIAYTYFKLKNYEQAAVFFQKHADASSTNKLKLNDTYLRLGDSQFVTAKYTQAIDAYDNAINLKGLDVDYATFQKAMCFGFLNKNNKKISELNAFLKIFSKSNYRDDALFELANSYTSTNNSALAVKTFDQLVLESKNGIYAPKALLRQGLIFYNDDKDAQALEKFKQVVQEFPKSTEAIEAVKTARLIYLDQGKAEEYAAWVKKLDFIEVSDKELDADTFEAAEKQYLQGNSKQAIANFIAYLKNFPNGLQFLKANFLLAECYFKEESSNSIVHYEKLITEPKNEYTEQALSRLCQIYLRNTNYEKAIPVLLKLESNSDFPQNISYSQANLMKSYYNFKDYANAGIYADKVLQNPKSEDKIKSDALIIIARSAIKTNNNVVAKESYEKLQKIAKGELAAEALYYDAYFKNVALKFEDSNKTIQKLSKDFASYKYFGAKGLVLMAKNFFGLKDSFQATYILESVIKNFSNFDDIVLDAKTQLEIIKTEEAKSNSSIIK